jgi:hypothetical protein
MLSNAWVHCSPSLDLPLRWIVEPFMTCEGFIEVVAFVHEAGSEISSRVATIVEIWQETPGASA